MRGNPKIWSRVSSGLVLVGFLFLTVSLVWAFVSRDALWTAGIGAFLTGLGLCARVVFRHVSRPMEHEYDEEARRDSRIPGIMAQLDLGPDPDDYDLAHVELRGRAGEKLPAEHPDAAYVTLYLERKSSPRRLIVTADIEEQQLHEGRLSSTDWLRCVPEKRETDTVGT